MPDHHDRPAVHPGQATHDGMIVGKVPIPGKRGPVSEQRLDIILAMRSVSMTSDLRLLPRGQPLVERRQHIPRLDVQLSRFFRDIDLVVGAGHGPQFLGLAFDFRERLFEIEILRHVRPLDLSPPIWRS